MLMCEKGLDVEARLHDRTHCCIDCNLKNVMEGCGVLGSSRSRRESGEAQRRIEGVGAGVVDERMKSLRLRLRLRLS